LSLLSISEGETETGDPGIWRGEESEPCSSERDRERWRERRETCAIDGNPKKRKRKKLDKK
jgi:hypothetical protein